VIPGNLRAYELGQTQNHATLRQALSKYAFGKFWVTSGDKEQDLRAVRRAFDDEVDTSGRGALHWLVHDGDAVAECRLLLSVGIDPDKPNAYSEERPSHWTTHYGRPLCAEALAPCRPHLTAVDYFGREKPSIMRVYVSNWSRTNIFNY
jgi:hypothetical protein